MPKPKKPLTAGQEPGAKAAMLTTRQELFCHHYVITQGNGTESARRAGYAGEANVLAVAASDLLRMPKIRERLRELGAPVMKKLGVSKERVLRELTAMALTNVGDFFEFKDGRVTVKKEIKSSKLAGLSGFTFTEGQHGDSFTLKMDKLGALEKVGTYVGLFEREPGDNSDDGSTPAADLLGKIRKAFGAK